MANGPALPGTACNDGDPNTGNDQWMRTVTAGQLIDCEGTPGGSALPGTSCNDGDANTINDQWTANCQCVGTAVTFDCEGVANGPALPGTACNDGEHDTTSGRRLSMRGHGGDLRREAWPTDRAAAQPGGDRTR
ncbi:MAG: hypothetical protein H6596_05540 [Flavobacteriales bacterium]|nr:hypothetical protein [Flavobacteriales bacterium]